MDSEIEDLIRKYLKPALVNIDSTIPDTTVDLIVDELAEYGHCNIFAEALTGVLFKALVEKQKELDATWDKAYAEALEEYKKEALDLEKDKIKKDILKQIAGLKGGRPKSRVSVKRLLPSKWAVMLDGNKRQGPYLSSQAKARKAAEELRHELRKKGEKA